MGDEPLTPALSPNPMKGEGDGACRAHQYCDATSLAFSLRGASGEGGRRPDKGCGYRRRWDEPLTPTLSPHPMKGEGEGNGKTS